MKKPALGLGVWYITTDGKHFRRADSYSHRTRPQKPHYIQALSSKHAALIWKWQREQNEQKTDTKKPKRII